MAAAGIAECSNGGRAIEFGRVRFEPAGPKVHVADRSGIARFRRLAEIERSDENPPGGQRPIDPLVVQPVAVVPRAAVDIDDAREWPASLRLIDARQPRLARQALILDVPLFDFELLVGFHAGNLLPPGVFLQARAIGLIIERLLFSIGARRYKWSHANRRSARERRSAALKRSTERILTTHVGSLPRPADLLEMNDARASGRPVDPAAWSARVKTAISEAVRRQREPGVDIVNDGELSKSSWSSYVNERLGGFAESVSRGQGSLAKGRDKKTFQEFYDEYDRIQPFRTVNGSRW